MGWMDQMRPIRKQMKHREEQYLDHQDNLARQYHLHNHQDPSCLHGTTPFYHWYQQRHQHLSKRYEDHLDALKEVQVIHYNLYHKLYII